MGPKLTFLGGGGVPRGGQFGGSNGGPKMDSEGGVKLGGYPGGVPHLEGGVDLGGVLWPYAAL